MIENQIKDIDLVEKLRKGDLEAFDLIFKKYSDRLYGFALNYLKTKEETEELVQNVFLKIWENRRTLKRRSNLKSFLFTIAYNEICSLFRRKKLCDKLYKEIGYLGNSSNEMEDRLEYQSVLEQVEHIIDKLPEKQRIIFIKSRKEGKSTKEIAAEMNLAPGTVDNHISSALKFIRKRIPNNNFGLLLFYVSFIQ